MITQIVNYFLLIIFLQTVLAATIKFVDDNCKTRLRMRVESLDHLEEETDIEGLENSAKSVYSIVEGEIRAGIPSNRIIIGGFSQGRRSPLLYQIFSIQNWPVGAVDFHISIIVILWQLHLEFQSLIYAKHFLSSKLFLLNFSFLVLNLHKSPF